jgi:YegS/Rv2252/BmrU family lipid kinase
MGFDPPPQRSTASDPGTPSRRRALVLTNAKASQAKQDLDPVLARMRRGGIEVEVDNSVDPPGVSAAIVARADEFDCVVLGGGDGTLNAAAEGLMRTRLPFGILPLGTANDLARTLGIPPDLEQAADIICAGRTQTIDVGSVNGHPFFNVASVGLSATLARRLTRETKKRWGRFAYAVVAFQVLASARPFTAWIASDVERIRVKSLQIAVGNGRHYGGGAVVEPTAAIDDGRLDLYSLEFKTVFKLALMLPAFRDGSYGAWQEVRTRRGVSFVIETRKPRSVNADGELVTKTPARFEVHRDAVTAIVPEKGADRC